jgi:hypothetical protein
MDDNSDIAFLAASTEREMRKNLIGSQGLRYNKTDFRKFLNPNQQISPQQAQQLYQQQQAQQFHPQQYHQQYPAQQQYSEPFIPDGTIPPANPQLLPLPQGYAQPTPVPQQQQIPSTESFQNFNIPNYNASPKQYLEDEQQFRDALIKEVKSLKNTIKDLKKQVTSLTLSIAQISQTLNPSTIPASNEDSNKS